MLLVGLVELEPKYLVIYMYELDALCLIMAMNRFAKVVFDSPEKVDRKRFTEWNLFELCSCAP